MLYQLSYASALKPTKNSRWFRESASSGPQNYEHASSQHCGKGTIGSLPGNPHATENAIFSTANNRTLWKSRQGGAPLEIFYPRGFRLDALAGLTIQPYQFRSD